jgi:hypothetical protein
MSSPANRKEELPEDIREWRQALRILWIRIFVALNKAAGLLIFAGVHAVLDWVLKLALPGGFEKTQKGIRVAVLIPFVIVGCHFLIDMVVILIPSWSRKKGGGNAGDSPKN